MSRIAQCFQRLGDSGRRALVPYLVAGDPEPGITVPMMHALVDAGADMIELGVPFSDPMAEGPVIQLAHERALAQQVSLSATLDMVAAFREQDSSTPVILMGYANPVSRMGYEAFAQRACDVGLDGLLTVDMPPEEADILERVLNEAGIDNIFLVAPTTPPGRVQKIAEQSRGFVYYVSLKGVTGAGHLDTSEVAVRVDEIRRSCSLPVAVGFGIKDADSAAAVARVADGVVVGSALVDRVAAAVAAGAEQPQAIAEAAALVKELRRGVDSVSDKVAG